MSGVSEKLLAPGSSLPILQPVDGVDLQINYQKGASIAYIRPLTVQGSRWLWDHVKYPYIGSTAIVAAEQLLAMIQGMDAHGLLIHWQS